MNTNTLARDHTARQFLPAAMAVRGPRFKKREWSQSQQVREILDSIYLEVSAAGAKPTPRVAVASSESIVMEANFVRVTVRTESGAVACREFMANLAVDSELALADTAPALEAAPTMRDAAAAALMEINRRKPPARRITAPAPRRGLWAWFKR
jgi:hypothetical protein